jgi:hypothetical protein
VCIGLSDALEIVSKIVEADSVEVASASFEDEFKLKPREILGPFFKKKTQILENTVELKFSTPSFIKAEYNGWLVNAFLLEEPQEHAYLVFISHLHNKKLPFPKGTIVVPISQLRLINE